MTVIHPQILVRSQKIFPKGVGSARDPAFLLLEAWRSAKLDEDDYRRIKYERFQFRIDSS